MTKRNKKKRRHYGRRKHRRRHNKPEKQKEGQEEEQHPTIYDQARMWYNARDIKFTTVDAFLCSHDAPSMALFIRDYFKKHEKHFVPHQMQLTELENRQFEASGAAPTYGECDLQDMARVMKKYETQHHAQNKLIIELGAGRGQLTALFFFSDVHTDVVACELSIQRFESACTFLRLLAIEFGFFHDRPKPNEFIIVNPNGCMMNLQQRNLFTLPQTIFADANLVMMDVHIPPSDVLDRDLVHIFRCLPVRTPLIAYNRNRRMWPSPPFMLDPSPECIRTDWNPDGYPFQVYRYHAAANPLL